MNEKLSPAGAEARASSTRASEEEEEGRRDDKGDGRGIEGKTRSKSSFFFFFRGEALALKESRVIAIAKPDS